MGRKPNLRGWNLEFSYFIIRMKQRCENQMVHSCCLFCASLKSRQGGMDPVPIQMWGIDVTSGIQGLVSGFHPS